MSTLLIRSSSVDYAADWTEFRKWLDGTYASLRYTWTDNGAAYDIAALDGPVFRTAGVNKTEPPSPEQVDFETNFKSQALPFEQRSGDGGLVVAQSPYAYSGQEATKFVGFLYSCPPGSSDHDEVTSKPIRLQGGYYWVRGASPGDRVSFSVVDVDNILGRGAGTVVSQYVVRLPVTPWDHQNEIVAPTAGRIPAGLYLRLTYENSGTSDVTFGVTYRWFEMAG